jgi:hypothetical protein
MSKFFQKKILTMAKMWIHVETPTIDLGYDGKIKTFQQ